MILRRRGFLLGALLAPAVIRTPGLLMPVRPEMRTMASLEVDTLFQTPQAVAITRLGREVGRLLPAGFNVGAARALTTRYEASTPIKLAAGREYALVVESGSHRVAQLFEVP